MTAPLTQVPSFTHACLESWSAWPDAPAILNENATLTYSDLLLRSQSFAGTLRAAGLRPGDRVAVAMERSHDAVVAVFGTIFAGGCPAPLEPRLPVDEIERRIEATQIAYLVHDEGHADVARNSSLREANRVAFAWDRYPRYANLARGRDDAALLLFTSGSTGAPKGVLLGHGNILTNAHGVIAHTGLTARDRLLHVMPIYHTNGLNNQLFAPLLTGASVVFADRFRAEDMPGLIARHRPTIVTGVPTMYSRMLDLTFDHQSLRGLRFARCGSAPITQELHRRVEEKLGCPLVVSYGLSEATCTNLMNPPERRRIGTVGTVLAEQSVRIMRPGSRAEAAPGEEGEIVIGGPALMLGYLGADPDADRAVADGWLRTGDLGRFDADGYLTITGRIKDVIIRGGENLYPASIEGAIAAIEGVRACCVVGRPDRDLGEVPVAFVVRDEGAAVTVEEIAQHAAARLPRPSRPVEIRFLEALPENAVGKVDRKAVAAMA